MEENKIISTQIAEVDNLVDFSDMMFNPIRAEYSYRSKNGSIQTVYVYNPDEEKSIKLMEIIKDNSTPKEDGVLDIKLSHFIILRQILPIITNYNFADLTDEQINGIIEKPAPILQEVMLDVFEIIKETTKLIYKLNKNTKEVLQEFGNLDDEKLNELVEKTKEIKSLEVTLEKEKQITLQEKAKTNEDIIKQMAEELNNIKNEKMLLEVELEKTKNPEVKPKRKYNKKNKVKDVVEETKEGETSNG